MRKSKILDLLHQMSIDEKIGQLVQYSIDPTTGPPKELNIPNVFNIGSILNIAGAKKVKQMQDEYLSHNRLKIPLLFMADVINGYKTIFPIPLAQGCSWDLNVVKMCTKIARKETSISGINVSFYPMVDLARDARWGRVMESIGGEDPFLAQTYARVIVNTYKKHIASCVKHFAGYGACEAGREYNSVDMSEREFRQYYLPGYKSAIDNGAEMVMTSFNILNGIPATINTWLLQDILRKELGFKGIIISDYSAIEETIAHGVSKGPEDAAYKAINAGVDIDMMSNIYINNLKKLVENDTNILNKINESVLRVLNLKNKLGLFENPYGNTNEEKEKMYLSSDRNLKYARKLTAQTFVLLKNNNILPLNKTKKIALIGPYADNISICGSWSIFTDSSKILTLKQVMEKYLQNKLLYAKGCEILEENEINPILIASGLPPVEAKNEHEVQDKLIEEAIDIAKKSDIIVLAIGEHYRQSGEACSRSQLTISKIQQNLLDKLYKLNKPIVALLFNGRPLELKPVVEKVDALLEVWFPGSAGAEAICDTIFGKTNPSGRLNMSFPQTVGQCPIYYNHYNTGRPHTRDFKFLSRYQDIPTEPFYPFGYGLSYCNFIYKKLELNKDELIATVTVKNESSISGYEVIQMYIQDIVASVVRPVKELKDFKKVYFRPYEEKQISFKISIDMLKFWNNDLNYVVENGDFKVYIGPNSRDTLSKIFTYRV